jgi:hypothetical protein
MIGPTEIDDKFDPSKWENITKLDGKETPEEVTAKINDVIDHVNYIFRFMIGAPE